jgi:hypothetical protein
MKSKLADIACKRAECDQLYRVLDLWAAVRAQGIDIDTVQSFGFDRSLVTERQRREMFRRAVRGERDPISGVVETSGFLLYAGDRLPNGHHVARVYNYVRHKDDTKTILNPMLKAP